MYKYTWRFFVLGRPSCRKKIFFGTDDPRLPTYLSTYEKLPTTEVSLYWATIIKKKSKVIVLVYTYGHVA